MPSRLRPAVSRLHVRRCVRCGYDGALLKGGRAPRCARCGCDLRARPALTYAEMEGFHEERPRGDVVMDVRTRSRSRDAQERTIERWLAAVVVAVVFLAAAAVVLTRSLR